MKFKSKEAIVAVSFERLEVGKAYERPELAELWGYEDWHAIGRGVVTPRDQRVVVLFITKEKQEALEQYVDSFVDGRLEMEGERTNGSDRRLAESLGRDSVHLFYRVEHHTPFTYCGEVFLAAARLVPKGTGPSHFTFVTAPLEAQAVSAIETEDDTHGPPVTGDEGGTAWRMSRRHERDRKLRALALKLHGTICKVCGFDFNQAYGADLARGFIEVHHIHSIAGGPRSTNPETDLIPLCSNCHSMAHSRPGQIVEIDELRARLSNRAS